MKGLVYVICIYVSDKRLAKHIFE